ncbi:hypothetical protein EDD85DRAFT_257759 [Armillaria nabsnona]|nr:hypothetical protein EDD85DRAFT_257759 [Armillaria nabsnona]
MASSLAEELLYCDLDEEIGSSTSLPALLYDWKDDEKDFPNRDALQSALFLIRAFCFSEDSSGSLNHLFYSELTDHFADIFKTYSNKVQLSRFARLNHTEPHVRHMLHLALILADVHKLLAKNALVFIDQILRGEAATTNLHQSFSKTAQSEMKHLMKCFLKIYSSFGYAAPIAILGSEVGKSGSFAAATIGLGASIVDFLNGGDDAAISVSSTSIGLLGILGMIVGNSIVSPDSMKELQRAARKIEEKVYTFTIAWRELSILFLHISVPQSVPQNGLCFMRNFRQQFCVDGTILNIFLAFTLRLEEDSFQRIRRIPYPIEELVIERAKRVENITWLSSDRYIESRASSMKRATNLIAGLVALLPARSQSPASVLPLHIMPPSPEASSVNQDMTLLFHITPTLSASETPHADPTSSTSTAVRKIICTSVTAFHDDLSTSPGAGGDPPETHTLVKRRPYSFHGGARASLLAGIKAGSNNPDEGDDRGDDEDSDTHPERGARRRKSY